MKTRTSVFLLSAALLLPLGSAHADDLLSIYELANVNDSRLGMNRARYDAAIENRPKARSALLPQISVSASIDYHSQRYKDVPAASAALYKDDDYKSSQYGLKLEQSLYDRKLWLGLQQATQSINQADAERSNAEQELILRTAQTYFGVLAAGDTLKFSNMEKQTIAQQNAEMQKRFENGLATLIDVKEAEAQLSLATAQEIDSQYQLSVEKENLRVITGQTPGKLRSLKANIDFLPPKGDMEDWTKRATENSLQIRAAAAAMEFAKQEIKRRKAAHLPTLGLNAEYGQQTDDGGFSEGTDTDASVGLQLKMPLYSGGQIQSEVREATALYREAQQQYELFKRETVRETRAAYLNVQASIRRMEALKSALSATESAYQASKSGLNIGTRTVVEVLVSLRDSLRAKKDYHRARYDYVVSLFRLRQSAGDLSVEDLKRVNDWLQDF